MNKPKSEDVQTQEYITAMLAELVKLAKHHKFDDLHYYLEMAMIESEATAKRSSEEAATRPPKQED